jgi:small multidrug resistance family-3 protein
MRELVLLLVAAALEVGGDALVRSGLKGQGFGLMAAGGVVLVAYGFLVNMTQLDFGRLMGIYIAVFFVVAQATAVLFFKERLSTPVLAGGLLIVAGGAVMTVWRGS